MHTIDQIKAGELRGLKRLELSCGLTEFPEEIFDLADSLEILDLSGNALSSLPDDLPRLRKLRVIFCSNNQFEDLPEVLGRCPELSMVGFKANRIRTVSARALPAKLRWLILTDNRVEALPDEIGACAYLQKLMLAGNALKRLPESLKACVRLELLRIAANQLTEFPQWLLSLPRLSWLAYAGNPFSLALEAKALAEATVSQIGWNRLATHNVLGQGASGVIYRADYRNEQGNLTPVAVKLFKGAVTSDGLPHCEMVACLAAGRHPSLIPVLGKVSDHPSGAEALVMELIEPEFKNLAGPPSLESCTRDNYPPEMRFDLRAMVRMAHAMASAARHLHQNGIMHGDLYAHNILHDGQGRALMGDFGAASFYSTEDAVVAEALQRLEVRAFGCLLEELLERCGVTEGEGVDDLLRLKDACLNAQTHQRPLFAEIEARLADILGSGRARSLLEPST
jgi:Protein tyrosine and serine/threonine kinase/Leucine rich repeat/Leucine Rich repeats (2 copies)